MQYFLLVQKLPCRAKSIPMHLIYQAYPKVAITLRLVLLILSIIHLNFRSNLLLLTILPLQFLFLMKESHFLLKALYMDLRTYLSL
ncbi:hypothetical protein Y888_06440 [Mixta calida B021323]|nr:hypothetical protein Y888_06440 [Mixta calida B021323]